MNFSQNNEQEIILKYFNNQPLGSFLDIGANDGQTLSNSRALALSGWSGVCVEPAPDPFQKLETLYEGSKVLVFECAIGKENAKMPFHISGTHLHKGDSGLLSTLEPDEMKRWQGTEQFIESEVEVFTWGSFYAGCGVETFDFISIDAEGLDLFILSQMNLTNMQTKLVCIEWNHNAQLKSAFHSIFKSFGMRLIHMNFENLIYGL
jgi:FkbM family methyltransferase